MVKSLDTNFNVAPYFDDYQDVALEKNYYRILFKPSTAVQTRELTQIQSLLQEQIARFGSYMFKDGSIIDGCAITYIPKYPVVYVANQFDSNNDFTVLDLTSNNLLVSNTGVRATVSVAKTGYELTYPESNRLYLNYIATGIDNSNSDVFEFLSGEKIYIYNDLQDKFGVLDSNNYIDSISVITANATANSTATAYGISVSDGIIFQKGFFINVEKHTIPVRDHDADVNNYVVGFNTSETLVNSNQDSSLLSQAQGFPNYNAPGADRLKLTATLVSKDRSDITKYVDFFPIVEFDNKTPTQQNNGEEGLNKILDVLATRTSEESGNYTIKPFTIEPMKYEANNQLFEYNISPGIVYVNGYRIEKINSFSVINDKATTVRESEAQIITGNYGNYVLVDEALGSFDFDNLGTVTFYDQAQNAISDYEGANTAPSGNAIGFANVLDFQFDSGNKGASDAQYRMYLSNIRMNSGKSFANDVKSIYANSSFGKAKADLVLESNTAVIKDSSFTTLIFPFGVDAIKRLRDGSGGNDTNFVFRDIKSATMAANGVATFTINSPANGGNERLNYSPGVLSSAAAENFNITTSADAYSANLTGTVNLSGTTTLTGAGTSFTTQFKPGELIRVNTGAGFEIRKVTAVTNNTSMGIDADISSANTAAAFQKYYPQGTIVNLKDYGGSITILSNTQFTVDTNLDLGTGTVASGTQTLYAQYQVLRSDAVEIKKEIHKNSFVKIDCSNNVAGATGPWDLGFVDIAKVRNIYVGTTYSDTNPERSEWFTINNGQRNNFYDHGQLVLKTVHKNKIDSTTKILVELDYFTANTTTGVGFFSVDSYPIDDANTANVNAIQTAEIPVFYSSTDQLNLDLRNCIDFRPRKFNTATYAANAASAPINPIASNTSFDVAASGHYLLDADTNFQADMEYYLPRIDLIVMNNLGEVSVRKGTPSENPIEPINENDADIIAISKVTAYPSLSTREANAIGRPDLAVKVNIKTNPVYTMKKIGVLEQRIARMEYYATLNMLEQKAKDMTISDENGLDRFKNGIFADSFQNHLLGKVDDIEYSISIDQEQAVARPKYDLHDVDFVYDANNSSGVTKTGNYLTRPYTHSLYISQDFASKVRNCTESVWKWNGIANLYPRYDHFKDTKNTPAINVKLDLSEPWEDFMDSPFGKQYGEWRTTSSKNRVSQDTTRTGFSVRTATTTTTTTTTTKSERLVSTLNVAKNQSEKISLGKYVTDFSINPFMRSRVISVIVTGLKPNTTMHVFFDNILVDQHCQPAALSGITNVESGKEDRILNATGNKGDILKSDSKGTLYLRFTIPENTFRVGDRELMVTNISDLKTESDAILTKASSIFTASSVSVTMGSTTLTTITPEISTSTATEKRTVTTVDVNVVQEVSRSPQSRGDGGSGNIDPISQTFLATSPENVSGIFISRIGVFFKSKSTSQGCTVYITETKLGQPDTSKILGKARLEPIDISVSDNSSAETIFTFDNPVYLQNATEYAFCVMPDANSPDYTIWCSEVGGYDIRTNAQIFSNPYSGILFVSANFNAWTAKQTEDLKFNIYRAQFTVGTGTARFKNEDDEYLTISGLTKANTSNRVEVGDRIIKVVSNTRISNTSNLAYSEGTIQYVDEALDFITLDDSNGNLSANDVIEIHRPIDAANLASYNANTLIATTTIVSVNDLQYNAVVPRFAAMTPMNSYLYYSFKGTNESYITDSTFKDIEEETETEFRDFTRIAASKSNEVLNMSGDKSSFFDIKLVTENTFVSPVIDLRRKSSIFVENIINNDATNEHTRYGNAITKYISQNITLDEAIGDSEDLNVYVGAYRPVGTDIEVYVKVLGSSDAENFDDKLWTKMTMTPGSEKLYSSSNTEDYKEFAYNIPSSVIASIGSQTTVYLNDGIAQYARSDGAIIIGFKTFCFKIVLLSENKANVPILADLRAIALQK